MAKNPVIKWIRKYAKKYNVDARAAVSVARTEGGLSNRAGDIGDLSGGGSYGPFQLYAQGALPAPYRGNPQKADRWAWSEAGIEYAIRSMARAGAAGLKGPQAIEAIVRKFERPADPEGQISKALTFYKSTPIKPWKEPAKGDVPKTTPPKPGQKTTIDQTFNFDPINNKELGQTILAGLMENLRAASLGQPQPFSLVGTFLNMRLQGLDGGLGEGPKPTKDKPGVKVDSKAGRTVQDAAKFFSGRALQWTTAGGVGEHTTGGVSGQPAIDFMAAGGAPVYAPAAGRVMANMGFGLNPRQDPAAGYGGSRMWIQGQFDSDPEPEKLFLTHFQPGSLKVKPGQRVKPGQLLGYVWHWPGQASRSHIHAGISGGDWQDLLRLFPEKK